MGEFVPFGADHLAAVGGVAAAVAALILGRKRLRGFNDRWIRRAVAAGLAGNELISWGVALREGSVVLPLQLCDLALFLTVAALLTLRPSVSRLAYFWGVGGSVQAMLTPDLAHGAGTYWWTQFFLSHGGIVLSVVYLALTNRVAPTHRSIWEAWGWTNAYAASVGVVNWALGTNYGYLARKPAHPSLLDVLGPWPWYLLAMEVLALASFYLCYAPFASRAWHHAGVRHHLRWFSSKGA
jgi:hypothetical integral membrane protein (TIGR02206 family)